MGRRFSLWPNDHNLLRWQDRPGKNHGPGKDAKSLAYEHDINTILCSAPAARMLALTSHEGSFPSSLPSPSVSSQAAGTLVLEEEEEEAEDRHHAQLPPQLAARQPTRPLLRHQQQPVWRNHTLLPPTALPLHPRRHHLLQQPVRILLSPLQPPPQLTPRASIKPPLQLQRKAPQPLHLLLPPPPQSIQRVPLQALWLLELRVQKTFQTLQVLHLGDSGQALHCHLAPLSPVPWSPSARSLLDGSQPWPSRQIPVSWGRAGWGVT